LRLIGTEAGTLEPPPGSAELARVGEEKLYRQGVSSVNAIVQFVLNLISSLAEESLEPE